MSIFARVESFLLKFCPFTSPILLALSGGADSLCLFYALLLFRKQYGLSFHVAHIDHGWRQESRQEAQALLELANHHQVPFHLKVLNPNSLTGNLEAACREERYAFFSELCNEIPFQGVLTGHHKDDQAETVFKRILEGAHWSKWGGLKSETCMKETRILRPLLHSSKKEILQALAEENISYFEDSSNRDLQFLRARLREIIFPRLNQEFGKQLQESIIEIGKDAEELREYFDRRLAPLIDYLVSGPWGAFLDLHSLMPLDLLEIKYLLRLLCRRKGFFLSREIFQQAAAALHIGKANQFFAMGTNQIRIDRKRLFMMHSSFSIGHAQSIFLAAGSYEFGHWKLKVSEEIYSSQVPASSWKEGWQGKLECYLPIANYAIALDQTLLQESSNRAVIKKRWAEAKVPAFLYPYFPLIWKGKEICHEFLTGKSFFAMKEGAVCWKVKLCDCNTA